MTSTDKPRRRNRQAATIAEPAATKRSAVTLSAEFSGGLDLTSIEAAAEALLTDYVMDRNGRTHDLIVMSYDVTGLTE